MHRLTTRSAPAFLIQGQIRELLGHLPGLWDGDPDSVHRARVAPRRLREILPLYDVSHPGQSESLTTVVRQVGRSLGRVRELDVMQNVLTDLETRVPSAACAVTVARSSLMQEQQAARRRMVKSLERLKVDRLAAMAPAREGYWMSLLRPHGGRWSGALRARIGVRAEKLAGAIAHATGVYFPKRVHAVRVAVKKLRYNIELADEATLWQPPHLLGDLKRIQETLGRLHDTQVLLERLDRLATTRARPEEIKALAEVLESDVAREHSEYVGTRSQLRAMCAACHRYADPRGRRGLRWPMAASAVALPAAVVLLGNRTSTGVTAGPSRAPTS